MRTKNNKKNVSWFLCIMLILTMTFITVGCGSNTESNNNQLSTQENGSG